MRRAPRGCASCSGAPALDQLARQMSVPARVAFLEDASDADRVIALEVGSYPVLGSAGSRVTEDPGIVAEALDALADASFSRWDGEAGQLLVRGLFPPPDTTGGYSASLAVLDDSDAVLATVSYDPALGVYLRRGGCTYLADERGRLYELLDDLVSSALEGADLPPAADGSRVWWYPGDWCSRAVSPAGSARP